MINKSLDYELEKIAKRYKGAVQGSGSTLRSGIRDISFELPNRFKAIRLVNAFKHSHLICYAHYMYDKEDETYSVWVYYQGEWECTWKNTVPEMLNAKQFRDLMRQEYS